MLSRLLRPFKGGQRAHIEGAGEPLPGPSRREYGQLRHATADFTEADDDDDDDDEDSNEEGAGRYNGQQRVEVDENGMPRSSSVLPLFSASHLDSLPVYSIVHSIRIIIQTRTETTLTWDQLRSPQVSQFLVKPMQQQIRTQHFSRATVYALMANCLQFEKEGQLYPGNAGVSSTRAKVCELLAIKLLKEYSTRELIDALSYDFYPLQGIPGSQTPLGTRDGINRPKLAAARTSTLEVAIRASCKHFLAHPLVVQQLEAIWNGAISFYSAADSLHRNKASASHSRGSWSRRDSIDPRTPLLGSQPGKEEQGRYDSFASGRRTVTLYDPRNASLFKLSRLRVPRYRQVFSTCSLAVLIGLFLAVLIQRSESITSLELMFWFWSAGFMLDELVGFNEQGFSLYIMSFWNLFDLGILMLLIMYYCMRIYGVFLADAHRWNEMAYDILAANAILLLPRIFSVLDHYQYFSQLLIAFRLMAVDLVAVFMLIMICCSGFFVFFTLSKNDNNAGDVAFKIFQILMGFTPAAWDVWPTYNWLGQVLMGVFLTMCHFVIVTILMSVLSNSFTAIASNANEEHQFLFAINTISMVKNDALFSYVAPGNIFAWMLMPLKYCMPLYQFVAMNRFIIKITHFPLLWGIFLYERLFLCRSIYEPTDLVDHPGRERQRVISIADPVGRAAIFSPSVRLREESVAGFQKDRALEEVFRRPPDVATLRTQRRNERRKTQTAIRDWMDRHDVESPHNYSTIDSRLGNNWPGRLTSFREQATRRIRQLSEVRSTASDPADLLSNPAYPLGPSFRTGISRRDHAEVNNQTDADGDDELVTNDEDEEDNATNVLEHHSQLSRTLPEDYFHAPAAGRFADLASTSVGSAGRRLGGGALDSPRPVQPQPRRGTLHSRTLSTNTILYNPAQEPQSLESDSSSSPKPSSDPRSRPLSSRHTPVGTPALTPGRRSPRRQPHPASRPRPIMPPRDQVHTAPNRATLGGLPLDTPARRAQRRLSSFDIGVNADAHSDLASAVGHAGADDAFGAVPASFATQMAMATGMVRPMAMRGAGRGTAPGAGGDGDSDRMSRIMLARMKTLEESFADVVREMRAMQRPSAVNSTAQNSGDDMPLAEVGNRAGRGAGTKRAKTTTAGKLAQQQQARPLSRRSMRENRVGMGEEAAANRSKGKGVHLSDGDDTDDAQDADSSFAKKGSSL